MVLETLAAFGPATQTADVQRVPEGKHGGEPNRARRRLLARVFEKHNPDYVVTIESDVVFNSWWLSALLHWYGKLWRPSGPLTLRGQGLATISPYRGAAHQHSERFHAEGLVTRYQTGGVCHLIPRWWYEEGKRPKGWMAWIKREKDGDWPEGCGGWDFMMAEQAKREGLAFAVMSPSLVDHDPGEEGGTSGSSLYRDRAVDFVGEEALWEPTRD